MIWITLKKTEKEIIKKRKITKNTWYDWYYQLINHIPESIKNVSGGKDQI